MYSRARRRSARTLARDEGACVLFARDEGACVLSRATKERAYSLRDEGAQRNRTDSQANRASERSDRKEYRELRGNPCGRAATTEIHETKYRESLSDCVAPLGRLDDARERASAKRAKGNRDIGLSNPIRARCLAPQRKDARPHGNSRRWKLFFSRATKERAYSLRDEGAQRNRTDSQANRASERSDRKEYRELRGNPCGREATTYTYETKYRESLCDCVAPLGRLDDARVRASAKRPKGNRDIGLSNPTRARCLAPQRKDARPHGNSRRWKLFFVVYVTA